MFGYLTPLRDELKVREFSTYRAHYCGVCRALRTGCSLPSCMSLTYDAAFLSLLGCSIGPGVRPLPGRCPFKPWKKIFLTEENPDTCYAADANLYFALLKCQDDHQDEHPFRGAAGELLLRRGAKKAVARLGSEVTAGVSEGMKALSRLEQEGCDSLDEPALAFGQCMETLLGGLPAARGQTSLCDPLRWIGKNLGRWVYLLDAWDDLEKDEKSGSYNVLLRRFGTVGQVRAQRERVRFSLLNSLYEAGKAASLLPGNSLSPIVSNILGEGAVTRTEQVLSGCGKQKRQHSQTSPPSKTLGDSD